MKKRYELNKNQELRDDIMKPFIEVSPYSPFNPEFYYFKDLPLETLKLLIAMDFADLDDRQNDGPSIMELVKFGDKLSGEVTFDGYAVGLSRSDYRITVDTVKGKLKGNVGELLDLISKYEPDSLSKDNGEFRAWWD